MKTITLFPTAQIQGPLRWLPSSKSLSNRALIINALSGNKGNLTNLSTANDTRLMTKLLTSNESEIQAEDAGTTMRFLTAYFSVLGEKRTLTGTARMKERPIGILVTALQELGATIAYLEKPGFPPLQTGGFQQKKNALSIRGDVSSQYISALMMIGPMLPSGLELTLEGHIGSRPYITMTARLMQHFGAEVRWEGNQIVLGGKYHAAAYHVESDWSAASYWYAFTALADAATLELPGLLDDSWQGDSVIRQIMEKLGVQTQRQGDALILTKGPAKTQIDQDFTDCPDLAQTVAVVCAAKGIPARFTGLESLRIKETDRILALQTELAKLGAQLVESPGQWDLIPTTQLPARATFATYHDHRMAMAFAPLATRMETTLESPEVVRKSYPDFWKDVAAVGITIAHAED